MKLPKDYFDAIYAADADPWKFADSPYEREKYDETIAALGGRRFARALEVGCSIGVLTGRLAAHALDLVAMDIADRALEAARARNADTRNITFLKAAFPDDVPPGPFDLVVLSEVLYYLDEADLALACAAVLDRLADGGDVVMVHWLGETDYPLTGDAAAEGFIRAAGPALTTVRRTRHASYRLDVLRRPLRWR